MRFKLVRKPNGLVVCILKDGLPWVHIGKGNQNENMEDLVARLNIGQHNAEEAERLRDIIQELSKDDLLDDHEVQRVGGSEQGAPVPPAQEQGPVGE